MNPLEFLAFSEAASFGKQLSAAQMHQRYMAAQSPRRQQRINRRIDRQLNRMRIREPIGMTPYGMLYGTRRFSEKERQHDALRGLARKTYRHNRISAGVIGGLGIGGILAYGLASPPPPGHGGRR